MARTMIAAQALRPSRAGLYLMPKPYRNPPSSGVFYSHNNGIARMSPEYILGFAIEPAIDLLGPQFGSVDAERMLLAIGLQESRFLHRAQIGGPARGYWQFERDRKSKRLKSSH